MGHSTRWIITAAKALSFLGHGRTAEAVPFTSKARRARTPAAPSILSLQIFQNLPRGVHAGAACEAVAGMSPRSTEKQILYRVQ